MNIKDHPTVNKEYNFGFYPQTLEVANTQNIANNAKIANNLLNGYVIYSNNLYKPLEINGETSYFNLEPVTWLVLGKTNQGYEMVAKNILDAKEYSSKDVMDDIYPSNYEHSEIRAYLNNDFYNSLFNEFDRQKVVHHLIDNQASTTRDVFEIRSDGKANPYVCGNTNDYVYLLAYVNFDQDEGYQGLLNAPQLRKAFTSDYCQMLMDNEVTANNYGEDWTRSPNNQGDGYQVSYVNASGTLQGGTNTNNILGIRPAITVNFD